jgi:hypothetical protein
VAPRRLPLPSHPSHPFLLHHFLVADLLLMVPKSDKSPSPPFAGCPHASGPGVLHAPAHGAWGKARLGHQRARLGHLRRARLEHQRARLGHLRRARLGHQRARLGHSGPDPVAAAAIRPGRPAVARVGWVRASGSGPDARRAADASSRTTRRTRAAAVARRIGPGEPNQPIWILEQAQSAD